MEMLEIEDFRFHKNVSAVNVREKQQVYNTFDFCCTDN